MVRSSLHLSNVSVSSLHLFFNKRNNPRSNKWVLLYSKTDTLWGILELHYMCETADKEKKIWTPALRMKINTWKWCQDKKQVWEHNLYSMWNSKTCQMKTSQRRYGEICVIHLVPTLVEKKLTAVETNWYPRNLFLGYSMKILMQQLLYF